MVKPEYLKVLRKIVIRLATIDVNWALTGSLSFALQGVPLEPRDIDLQTDAQGAYAIQRCFMETITRPVAFSSADRIRSHFGALLIDRIQVEIMGDLEKRLAEDRWDPPPDLTLHKRFVRVEAMFVPVLSLEYEYAAYMTLGRIERAQLLKAAIENPFSKGTPP
jgi:hypothetical protein